jgi:hypothetical protein
MDNSDVLGIVGFPCDVSTRSVAQARCLRYYLDAPLRSEVHAYLALAVRDGEQK